MFTYVIILVNHMIYHMIVVMWRHAMNKFAHPGA